MLLALQYKLCQRAAMRGNMIYDNELTCVAIRCMATNKIAWQTVLLPRHDYHGNNIWSLATNKITWQMILLPRDGGNNIWSLTTNKIAWQIILLPRHNDRGNNVWPLATNKIAWQMVYLPRHNGPGNNTLGNKIVVWQYRLLQRRYSWQIVSIAMLSIVAWTTSCYKDGRGKCLYCHDHERCGNVLLPCSATDNYGCKKPQHFQRQTSNGCNTLLQRDFLQPLATNVIWLQHLPFATKLGLLQHFFVVAQGLEVSRERKG
jgi:hypothetical protein